MKYSVIVPVYKAENTIARCIESLINQNYENAEILLINDGSPDESGNICKKYAQQFKNIRYFEKENGGVSSARNIGLQQAIGEYILFVDSDDYVESGYFSSLDAVLDKYNPDLLLFSLKCGGENKVVWNTGDFYENETFKIARRISDIMRAYLFSALMSKVFKRKIIIDNSLYFDESLDIGEDQTFIFEYAMNIKNIASTSVVLYNLITDNADSLSRKKRDYLTEQLLRVNQSMLWELKCSGKDANVYRIYYNALTWQHYRSAYSCCKELCKFDYTSKQQRHEIRHICKIYTKRDFIPWNIKNAIIALPIIIKSTMVINLLINFQNHRRSAEQ